MKDFELPPPTFPVVRGSGKSEMRSYKILKYVQTQRMREQLQKVLSAGIIKED